MTDWIAAAAAHGVLAAIRNRIESLKAAQGSSRGGLLDYIWKLVSGAEAAALRAHRTITTSEEVAELPDDTFITFFMNGTDEPFSYEVHRIRNGLPHRFDKGELDRWLTCTHIRVLYRPDDDSADDE